MCLGAGGKDEGDARSKEIEKELKNDQKKMSKEVKLLLLGKESVIRLAQYGT